MLSRRSRGGGEDPAAEEVGLAAADTDREQRIRTKEQQQQQQQQQSGDRDSTAQQSKSLFKRTKKLFGGRRSPGGKMMPPTKGGDGEGGGDGPRTHTATRTSRPTGNTTSSMGKGRKSSAPAQLQPALVPGAYAVSTAADDAAAAAAAGALATATATAGTEAMTADADADAKAPALVVREDSVLVGPELPVEVDHIQHNEDDARAQARAYLAEEEEYQRVLALSEASPSVPHAQHDDGAANDDDDDDDDEIALAIKLSLQEQQQQRPPASPPSTRDNDSDSPENYKLPAAAAAPREVKRLPVPLTVEEADPASISTEEPAVEPAVRIKSYDQLRARRLEILRNLEGSPRSPLLRARDPPVTSWNDAGSRSRSSGLHVPTKYFRDYGSNSNTSTKGGGGATRTCSGGGIGSDATTNTTKSTTGTTTLSPKDICSMLQTALEVSALPLPEETTTSAADRHRHRNVRHSFSSALSRIVQTDEVRAAETKHITEVAKIRDESRDDLLLSLLSEAGSVSQSSLLSVDNPEEGGGGGAPADVDVERRERRAIGDALLAVSAAADRRRGEDAGMLRSARSRAE